MNKKRIFTGAGVAVITPFTANGIDFCSFKRIIDFQMENNTKAIIVCGTTGEAPALSEYEQKKIINFAVEYVNGRVPVIAGTGCNSTAHSAKMSKFAAKAGVDGLLLITPYYNKPTQNGIIAHFFTVADSVGKPVIVYNIPSRTGVNITPESYLKLSEHENIVGVKEANGNIAAAAECRALTGASLDIYSGNDSEIIPFLALGGAGVISVMANILPKETSDICELFFSGRIKESLELQLSLMGVCRALFVETNPIPVKYAMQLMGYCSGIVRLPLTRMDEKNRSGLESAMRKAGISI